MNEYAIFTKDKAGTYYPLCFNPMLEYIGFGIEGFIVTMKARNADDADHAFHATFQNLLDWTTSKTVTTKRVPECFTGVKFPIQNFRNFCPF